MGELQREAVSLGDVADVFTGFAFKSRLYSNDGRGVRLLGGDNIAQGTLRWDNVRRWPSDSLQGLDPYFLAAGDVVLAMDRPWIELGLKRAHVAESDLPLLLVQRTARIRGGERLDSTYLRYVVASRAFTDYLLSVQTGTAIPHISTSQVKGFRFDLPPLAEQRAIAHILGTLDDKIELNRRTSETLEAMARALFNSWFVDFDPVRAKAEGRAPSGMDAATAALFPGEFVESAVGLIPRGWRVGSLGDVAKQVRDTVDPTRLPPSTPYVGLEHMPQRSIALGAWGKAGDAQSQKTRFARGSILFGKLRPYFHKVGVANVDGVASTDIVVASPSHADYFGLALGHMSSDAFVAYTNAGSDGTKMPRTSWERMASYPVVVPDPRCAKALSAIFASCVERIRANVFESRTLTELRDALLPRLLSGGVSTGCASHRDGTFAVFHAARGLIDTTLFNSVISA